MSYHYDWLMRQIEAITAMLQYLATGEKKHAVVIDIEAPTTGADDPLYLQLQALVQRGQICKAEDLLYEALEENGTLALDTARRFYQDLNRLSDEQLTACNFSREEILEGLQTACTLCGIPI